MARAALFLTLLLFSPVASARECPVILGGSPELQAVPAEVRLEYVRQRLLEDGDHSKAWWIGWLAFLSAAEAFQIAAASVATVVQPPPPGAQYGFSRFLLNVAQADAPGLWAGSVTTLLGIANLTMAQAHAPFAGTAFDLHLRQEPLLDTCIALAEGERLLLRNAADERQGRGWLAHVLNVAVSLVSSLIVGVAFKRYVAAGVGFPLGVGVGEVFILTEPTTAITALDRYKAGNVSSEPPIPNVYFAPGVVRLQF